MPDTLAAGEAAPCLVPPAVAPPATGSKPAAAPRRSRRRWVSPLMRRILLVNALPLALLVATLLYLNQFQNSLLEAEVTALREQARIYAGALGQSAVGQRAAGAATTQHPRAPSHNRQRSRPGASRPASQPAAAIDADDNTVLVPELVRPLLLRLTEPSPSAQARLFAPDGQQIADSRADPDAKASGAVGARSASRDPRLRRHPAARVRPAAEPAAGDPAAGCHARRQRRPGRAAAGCRER